MSAKIGNELYCRVIEWNEESGYVARNFCLMGGTMDMIDAFSGNIGEIAENVAAIAPVEEVPEPPNGETFEVEVHNPGAPSNILTVRIEEEALLNNADEDVVLTYAEVDECWACYHLIEEITDIKAENECCMKMSVAGTETHVCSNKPTEEC